MDEGCAAGSKMEPLEECEEVQDVWLRYLTNHLEEMFPNCTPVRRRLQKYKLNLSLDELLMHVATAMGNFYNDDNIDSKYGQAGMTPSVGAIWSAVTYQICQTVFQEHSGMPLSGQVDHIQSQLQRQTPQESSSTMPNGQSIDAVRAEMTSGITHTTAVSRVSDVDEERRMKLRLRMKRRFSYNKHGEIFTKDLPASYAYCARGVMCKICWEIFKGVSCVDELVQHTVNKHRKFAKPHFLQKLRMENTSKKIIGKGMNICFCKKCIIVTESSIWKDIFDKSKW